MLQQRDYSIDLFKGILVIGMVYAHVIQFFGQTENSVGMEFVSNYANVITFSGFVFCFGYVFQKAYLTKPFEKVWLKMVVTSLKTLAAFYLSGLSFRIFISGIPLQWEHIGPVLLLKDIPGWSEFLVSFALFSFISIVLFPWLKRLIKLKLLFWTVNGLLLLTTWFPYDSVTINQLGLLIGTRQFAVFPVLQYMPYYLIGIYFARHSIGWGWKWLIGSALATGIFIWDYASNGWVLPERFPPTVQWILGATLILYLYYLFTRWVVRRSWQIKPLISIGQNVLFYLLISNIFIFALDSKLVYVTWNAWQCLGMTFILLFIISYLQKITVKSSALKSNNYVKEHPLVGMK